MGNTIPLDKSQHKQGTVTMAYGFKRAISNIEKGYDSSLMKELGGCKSCPYLESTDCPHYPDVTYTKSHANGVCQEFTKFVKAATTGNYVGLTKQKQYIELLKDQMVKDKLFREFKATGEIPEELLDWAKHISNNLTDIRKQEEGSKVNIKREISPQDIAEWMNKKDNDDVVIDAEIVDKEDEEHGMRKTKEEISEGDKTL